MENPVVTTEIRSKWRVQAASKSDIHLSAQEARHTIFKAEELQYLDHRGKVIPGGTFYDDGSNICYVQRKFAKQLGLKSIEMPVHVMQTGNHLRKFDSEVYRLSVKDQDGKAKCFHAYGVDCVSSALEDVDLTQLKEIFPHISNVVSETHRAVGEIKVLLPITYQSLFPTEVGENNGLRIFRSKLMPQRLVIAGAHPRLNLNSTDALNAEVANSRNLHILSMPEPIFQMNRNATIAEVEFWKGEELGVNQPARCSRCKSCCYCSQEAQTLSRKESLEYNMIRDAMRIVPNPNDKTKGIVKMEYPSIKDLNLLKDNYSQAIAYQMSVEKRLDRIGLRSDYNAQFQEYIDNGVFKELTDQEKNEWNGPINYVVHHGVIKPSSTSTKLRIVSNSSLPNNKSGNLSLNDCLPKGPKSILPIINCQVDFRSHRHVCTWDLKKAYNSVQTGPKELHIRRMVWRVSADQPWKIYGINAMHFGDRPASTGLEIAKAITADAGFDVCPETATQIKKGYVDDNAGGGTNEFVKKLIGTKTIDANGKYHYDGTVAQIMAYGGFGVKIMVRDGESRPDVLENFGGHVLGLQWDPEHDILFAEMPVNFSNKVNKIRQGPNLTLESIQTIREQNLTKRVLLSQVAGSYDPLGMISPLTIKLKILLQKVVETEATWDLILPDDLMEEAYKALEMMIRAQKIPFLRSFLGENWELGYELIGFFDGGNPASAAVVYARTLLVHPHPEMIVDDQTKTHEVRFVIAKARVTPTTSKAGQKRKSTPRTEMRGLLILARLVTTVVKAVSHLPKSVLLAGDSQTIISAMEASDRLLDVWYGNRVEECHEQMQIWENSGVIVEDMQHWPGDDNIADIATKGQAKLADVQPGSRWQQGPEVLQHPRSTWPIDRSFTRVRPESFINHANRIKSLRKKPPGSTEALLTDKECPTILTFLDKVRQFIARISMFSTLVGAVARWMAGSKEEPTVNQRDKAEHAIFMAATAQTNRANFKRFSPTMEKGVLGTSGGRLGRSAMHQLVGKSHLPLLDSKSPLARTIMLKAHEDSHGATDATLEASRRIAWIAQGRKLAHSAATRCLYCRTKQRKRIEQLMGKLPPERTTYGSQTFAAVNIDLFGPYKCKSMVNSRAHMKTWPLLVVCQATGAIHCELLHSYGTKAFLDHWEKFVSIRGRPGLVVSDQGSNFTSKSNYVAVSEKESPDTWNWGEVAAQSTRKKTVWKFVPPGAQWRNGLAERRVALLKKTLDHVLCTSLLGQKPDMNYAQFQALLAHIANIVNDRPVNLQLINEDELAPLTVNMLILGRNRDMPARVDSNSEDNCYDRQHEFISELEKLWWNQWRTQALSSLLPHHSYKTAKRHVNLQPGDVCMWLQDSKLVASYRLVRVLEAHVSENDGVVRTATITFLPKNILKKKEKKPTFKPETMETKKVAVQSLALLITAQEIDSKFDADCSVHSRDAKPLPTKDVEDAHSQDDRTSQK